MFCFSNMKVNFNIGDQVGGSDLVMASRHLCFLARSKEHLRVLENTQSEMNLSTCILSRN